MGIYLVDSAVGFHSTFSLDIVVYKVDSATYLLNNRGLFVVVTLLVSTVFKFLMVLDPEE